MTNFEDFRAAAKMRHDFSDQIMVRFGHANGENYDTWVSGKEVMQRLRSEAVEARIKGLSRWNLKRTVEEGKEAMERQIEQGLEAGKEKVSQELLNRLSDAVSDVAGGNLIGDSLAAGVKGQEMVDDVGEAEKRLWRSRLEDETFRAKVLELAWINLRGSFPESEPDTAFDDWL